MTDEVKKRGRGRPKREDEEAILKEQLAARKEYNMAKKKTAAKKASSKGGRNTVKKSVEAMYADVETMPGKVDLAIDGLLNGLIKDTNHFITWGGERQDNKNNQERKNLLNIVKDEISVIRSLRELREVLKDEKAKDMKQDLIANRENVALLEEARQKMAEAGINPGRLEPKKDSEK